MDNASKALLLSGAILLAIAVIGVGMTVFNRAQQISVDAMAPMDALTVSAHNNRFRQYISETGIRGSLISALVGETSAYNATLTNPLLYVEIQVQGRDSTDINNPAKTEMYTVVKHGQESRIYINKTNYDDIIIFNKTYIPFVEYSQDGIIKKITYKPANN